MLSELQQLVLAALGWLSGAMRSFGHLWQIVGLALHDAPAAGRALLAEGHPARLALGIALLAGMAQMVGHSVILFSQRVRPARFVASVLCGGVLYALGLLIGAVALWLVAGLALPQLHPALEDIVVILWLASAPLILEFFVMAATVGPYIDRLLHLWSWGIVLVTLRAVVGLGLWQAAAWLALSWLVVRLARLALRRPLAALEADLWRAVAGVHPVAGLPAPSAARLANGEEERETALLLSAALGARLGSRRRNTRC